MTNRVIDENSPEWGRRPAGVRLLTQVTPNGIERWLTMYPGYDFVSQIPRKDYGIHGVELQFGVKRGNVAVIWTLMTDWFLPQVRRRLWVKGDSIEYLCGKRDFFDGLGGIDYHSPVALHTDQTEIEDCKYTGGKCFPGGSGLGSIELFNKMTSDPNEIWRTLDKWLLETEDRVREQIRDARQFS
jgi:hypothetical protein